MPIELLAHGSNEMRVHDFGQCDSREIMEILFTAVRSYLNNISSKPRDSSCWASAPCVVDGREGQPSAAVDLLIVSCLREKRDKVSLSVGHEGS